ncbi:MAG: tetratricopeptide repeat protein [Paludibacteraceae bacterium]|nr:tetratricopeptide repeat protein [Paludibacteraceae bacterium]
MLFTQCSTKNNNAATRSYHYVTARYNVYFNANKAFLKVDDEIHKSNKDNYSEILPVFPLSNPETAAMAKGKMDYVLEKCQKTIKTHSIVKKPKKDPKRMRDPEYKAFLEKEEYNSMVQQAWLLMGKAQFYQSDFLAAVSTFSYIKRHFDDNKDVCVEASLWEARTFAELGWYYEAEESLKRIDEKTFTHHTNEIFVLVKSDLLLKQGYYEEAIPFLLTAVDQSDRKDKARMSYILAQVYEKLGNYPEAYKWYEECLDNNPLHELEFNAMLSQARCYQGKDIESLKAKLEKLIKKQSNSEYLDQIYFTIGELYQRNGNEQLAIKFYDKAINESIRGGIDKAKAQVALGEIYYSKENYLKAQPLYSEAIPLLPTTFENYPELSKKSLLLNDIAKNQQTIVLEDSLQYLSTLSKEQQIAIIEEVIKKRKEEEAEQQRKLEEAARIQSIRDQNAAMGQTNLSLGELADKSWYFYNPSLITRGRLDFQKTWGSRALEDDWRRSNKSSNLWDFSSSEDEETQDSLAVADSVVEKQYTRDDVEYYLRLIPQTPEQMATSNQNIENSLVNLFTIFESRMGDNDKARDVYDTLVARFPNSSQLDMVRYRLYQMYSRNNKTLDAKYIKDVLYTKHPDSKYTRYLQGGMPEPSTINEKVELLYRETYEAFKKGDANTVKKNAYIAETTYSEHELMPKFMFLSTVSTAKEDGNETFKANLQKLVEKYPNNEVSTISKNIVALMEQGKEVQSSFSVTEIQQQREQTIVTEEEFATNIQKAGFSYDPESAHIFICIVEGEEDVKNKVLYSIAQFNFSRFLIKDFDLSVRKLDDGGFAIAVKGLMHLKEANWYQNMILTDANISAVLGEVEHKAFVISEDNFIKIFDKESVQKYLDFVNQNQLEVTDSEEIEKEIGFVK